MSVILRPFQRDFNAQIVQAWDDGARDVLGVLPCGAGKSVVAAHRLTEERGAAVFIAHRAELVSGESLALARNGVRHRVIGQDALRRECARRHLAEGLPNYVDGNAHVAIASVDTLVGLPASDPWLKSVRLAITDECFPAGTMVDGTPIEQIRVGDCVTAFDERGSTFRQRRVTKIHKNIAPKHMMRIAANTHHVIHCTLGHPFWTKSGWKTASELSTSDEVYCDQMYLVRKGNNEDDRITKVSVTKDGASILRNEMRDGVPNEIREETCRACPPASSLHDVRGSRGAVPNIPTNAVRRNWASLLLQKVFGFLPGNGIVGNDGAHEPKICFRADDPEQPHAVAGSSSKSERDIEGGEPYPGGTRGERETPHSAGNDFVFGALLARVRDAIRNKNWSSARKWRLSAMLQTKFGKPDSEDRGGGRRKLTLCSETQSTGREEGRIFAWYRLDSVEVYEPTDTDGCGGGFVYNLEVEDLHTYIANGVVVHNCHHLLRDNKWGRALDMFPNARGLGLTATPVRADGKGLGRHADGVFDVMVEGPNAREIELMGFLAPHVVYAPPSDLDLSAVPVTASGDYSPKPLAAATHKSHIVGDVVEHYLRHANGLLGMTFTVDVAAAVETAAAFRRAGVPSEVVSGKTPADLRNAIFRRFRQREIMQLVSCEIAGEGFDLPDVEVISLARASESYALATQQIGRVKRILKGKERGIVIDHVSNVVKHCPIKTCPQTGEFYIAVGEREWTLDRRDRRTSTKRIAEPITTCPECLRSYPRVLGRVCPYCKHETPVAGRSSPEQVEGVLHELDPQALARLQGMEIREDDVPAIPYGATPAIRGALLKHQREKWEAQVALRDAIALWGGWYGRSVEEAQRGFWMTYGVDVLTAQSLKKVDAEALRLRIVGDLTREGVMV